MQPEQVISYASEVFGLAKKNLDKLVKDINVNQDDLAEFKSLTRVALSNQINILRLGPGPKLDYNFETNCCFPIISFVPK